MQDGLVTDLSKEGYNYIMLDVDGVLISHRYTDYERKQGIYDKRVGMGIDPEAVKLLAKICEECHARIILSATARKHRWDKPALGNPYSQLVNALSKEGLRIYDQTPILDSNRPLEVAYWIDMHFPDRGDCNFVVLDDDQEADKYEALYPGWAKRTVKTSMKNGMVEHHANEAINILKRGEKKV